MAQEEQVHWERDRFEKLVALIVAHLTTPQRPNLATITHLREKATKTTFSPTPIPKKIQFNEYDDKMETNVVCSWLHQ